MNFWMVFGFDEVHIVGSVEMVWRENSVPPL